MIQIIDNAIPNQLFNRIVDMTINNEQFVFGASRTAVEHDKHISFSANIIDYWEFNFFCASLYTMAEKAKISFDEVFRVRFGLIHRDIEQITNLAHIDDFRKHKVALLYLNDTDGNTKIYNQKHNFDEPNSTIYSDEDFTIKTEVEPKANRVVFFDGSYYHSSMTPTKTQLRYTINFNFI